MMLLRIRYMPQPASLILRPLALGMQLLVTVNSRPQLQAVIARMERRAKELGRESSFVSRGRWGHLCMHLALQQ